MAIEISHYDLCKITAQRFLKESDIVLFEYQSFATGEFPDVLCFKNAFTKLFEIKVSRSDFLADAIKDSRRKWKPKVGLYGNAGSLDLIAKAPELYYIEAPHLGLQRYYVCPSGIIKPDEVPDAWGLYWYSGGRFYQKKKSGKFRRNIHEEISILSHAFRKYHNGNGDNILVKDYK